MRYALIADIHGNLHALQSVLDDARSKNVDYYILLGDYYLSCPYPNKVVNTIKNLKKSIIISGNEELHIKKLINQNQSTWTDGQMQALYHSFNALSEDNKEFLIQLPNTATIKDGNITITAFHDFDSFFRVNDVRENKMSSINIALMLNQDKFSPKQAIGISKDKLLSNAQLIQSLNKFSNGIYVFGHNHLQYHFEICEKIFINPGSCGLPLDGILGAPYSIVNILNDSVTVEEHRVKYDINNTINDIYCSSMYPKAKVWYDIIVMELTSGMELVSFFLDYVRNYAESIGDNTRPYSYNTWENAFSNWKEEI